MANPEHLAKLKEGVEAWNRWRKESPAERADLSGAKLIRADLQRTDLTRADLSGADLIGADLSRANLGWADLSRANLSEADLSGADLSVADLYGADLSGADFSGADLSGASLSRVNLNRASLSRANLSRARLSGANLSEANLSWANLEGAKIGYTTFGDVDLSQAKGLDKAEHWYPSTIGLDTIYKSGGNIPTKFLRGCGVPEDFITYMRSLVNNPIEYYSCFISYSTKDQAFADRLHADLDAANVRHWFAPHDMPIGDKIRERIDESIRIHDKLLLVLSSNSIFSNWVEKEVETAFEQEQPDRKNRTVLFPIRLDGEVMTTDKAWAADIRRTRHIGDFTRWKDHDAYQENFQRLLRDLKASAKATP